VYACWPTDGLSWGGVWFPPGSCDTTGWECNNNKKEKSGTSAKSQPVLTTLATVTLSGK